MALDVKVITAALRAQYMPTVMESMGASPEHIAEAAAKDEADLRLMQFDWAEYERQQRERAERAKAEHRSKWLAKPLHRRAAVLLVAQAKAMSQPWRRRIIDRLAWDDIHLYD